MRNFKIIEPIEDGSSSLTKLSNLRNSIFLAGPCPRRDYSDDWRFEAFEILEKLGFEGNVITPTNKNYRKMEVELGLDKMDALFQQTQWERKAMHMASAIVFWIPRSEKNPARTTNIEFGEWYKKNHVFVGWPNDAIKNEYLEIKLNEQKKQRWTTLEGVLKQAVESLKRPTMWYFTADTHFKQSRTLKLSRRPFIDVNEMDLEMISNWNKNVTMQDIVYHAGDFIDPEKIQYLKPLLDNLNFKELHWTLGNYDRKILDQIRKVADAYGRKIFLYNNGECKLKTQHHSYVITHEPNDFEIKADENDIILFGHIHGRSFAKKNGFDLSIDYHRFTPLSIEQVEWFADAMKYWDKNVYSDKVNVSN